MENPCKILFFGDSITRIYAPRFTKILKTEYPMHEIEAINAGVIGDTSRDGLKRLGPLLKERPDVAVVDFGMNDWRKGVGKKEFTKNISAIIDRFQEIGSRVVIATINPDHQGFLKGTSCETDEYSQIIREVALEKRIKVADVNSMWKREIKPARKGLRDKIHPNARGYEVIYMALMTVVPQDHTVVLWQYNGRECKCNYNCPYCYYAFSPKSENYFWGDIEEWREAFKKSFGEQNLVFYLAFGEPMLGEAFYSVLEMIEWEPKWSVRITTNLSQPLDRLVRTGLAKQGRININASFHPTQANIDDFLDKLLFLRKHGIEAPVVYVMWPGQMDRFENDFKLFDHHDFVVHVRRFRGWFRGKHYPEAYTGEERRFVARYCDDITIKYMLNEKPVFDRLTYSGFHFFVVDCTGNVGLDSDCFHMRTKYRTLIGNVIQSQYLCFFSEPPEYPLDGNEGTVDGVSNYLETGLHQLQGNNVLHFSEQGGVYRTEKGVHYKNLNTDFTDSKTRAEYYFPPRNLKDKLYLIRKMGLWHYLIYKNYYKYKVLKPRFEYIIRFINKDW